jgi:hypothetical protein
MEQAEIWKVFRAGRWVTPVNVGFQREADRYIFQGEYYNQLNKTKRYHHQRQVTFYDEEFFLIEDIIDGKSICSLEILIHFHPECSFQLHHDYLVLNRGETSIRIIWNEQQTSASIANWFYVPEFGIVLDSQMLILKPSVENARKLYYVITPLKYIEAAENTIDDLRTEAKV